MLQQLFAACCWRGHLCAVAPHTSWWLHGRMGSIIPITSTSFARPFPNALCSLLTGSLDTQGGSEGFRKCQITQKGPLKVQHQHRKLRAALSGHLLFCFVPTLFVAFFFNVMQCVVLIERNLNRPAWQRQKRAQPLNARGAEF